MRNVDLWRPELRRAMIKARPEYFSWLADRQERYGVAIPEQDRTRLEEALLKELFGRSCAEGEDSVSTVDRLSLSEQNLWNETVLPLYGIGEDCFFLNELLAEGKTMLDFESVRSYDEDDYRFQEKARKKEDPGYAGKPYRGSLYLSWARLYVDGRFTYATLSMATGYVHMLEDATEELLEAYIPHRYVPGKYHGKVQGDSWQWDLRVDADGQEGMLKELQRRIWRYLQERYDALLNNWDSSGRAGVYLLNEPKPPEANLHVVFTNTDALAAVRFRSFLRDCRAIERSPDELNLNTIEEKEALSRFVEEQHADVIRTFNPKAAKLQRLSKIMVRKGAFDDLK